MASTATEFEVFVDDNFHYQDEDERYRLGVFPTYAEALVACQRRMNENLTHCFKAGMTAAELLAQWRGFGEDPWIRPTPAGMEKFSAETYATQRAAEMCG